MTYKPTKEMQDEARKALKWKSQGYKGGTRIGLTRAYQILHGKLSEHTVKRMYSFFRRHEVDKQSPKFYSNHPQYPSPGRVAWSLWGGDPGYKWSKKIRNSINR